MKKGQIYLLITFFLMPQKSYESPLEALTAPFEASKSSVENKLGGKFSSCRIPSNKFENY